MSTATAETPRNVFSSALARAVLLAGLAVITACDSAETATPQPPAVLVVEAAQRDVPIVAEWLGTTEGFVDAEIRAQVAGYLISRDYQEGARVSKGDLLFRIDPRTYREAVARAEAELQSARAQQALAKDDARRAEELFRENVISRQRLDSETTGLQTAVAGVEAAQAAVEKARLDLGFTEIRSPIDGIVGVAIRQLGDFASPTDPMPLTTVSQLDPIRVSFALSEQEYLRYSTRIQAAVRTGSFPVGAEELILADGSVYPYRGTGHPAGREVDPRSGTIVAKGVFPNPDLLLRPGQYARVRVEMELLKDALVVPQRAVRDLQGLAQLVVVADDGTIEVRTIKTGPVWGTLQVVTEGVSVGERVVVEGFQKAQPGTKVVANRAPPELAGAPPLPSVASPPSSIVAAGEPAAGN